MESGDTALVLRTEAGEEETPQALQTELQVNLVETRERLGIPDPDTPDKDVAELEHLRQMVHEQEQAKLEALQTAAELHLQLANAHAETAKAKKQYYGVPKSRDTVTRVESELAEVRTQLHAAKKELDWEQRSRRTEAIQASARVKSLETELATVTAAIADAQSPASSHRVGCRGGSGRRSGNRCNRDAPPGPGLRERLHCGHGHGIATDA